MGLRDGLILSSFEWKEELHLVLSACLFFPFLRALKLVKVGF